MPDSTLLSNTIRELISPGKGVYATDASSGSMTKRFEKVGIESTDKSRADFREVMLTTKDLSQYISGVILNDEIIRQKTSGEVDFGKLVTDSGILLGIKVDKKCKDMANYPGELIVEGLDDLRERFAEYLPMGVKFSKWRAVITIGKEIPTRVCIDSNAHATARYAAISQEAGVVPIVEPEVVMDGDHDIERCGQVTGLTIKSLFYHLNEQKVDVANVILKINMVLPGKDSNQAVTPSEVAEKTIEVLTRHVPKELPAVVFLSGGQSAEDATIRLNEIIKLKTSYSFTPSFSFERALEGPAMELWGGKPENIALAQKQILHRAKMNSLAVEGRYESSMEEEANA